MRLSKPNSELWSCILSAWQILYHSTSNTANNHSISPCVRVPKYVKRKSILNQFDSVLCNIWRYRDIKYIIVSMAMYYWAGKSWHPYKQQIQHWSYMKIFELNYTYANTLKWKRKALTWFINTWSIDKWQLWQEGGTILKLIHI